MLRHLFVLAALLTSTSAMAGSITYDFRFENVGTNWNDDTTGAGVISSNNRFVVKKARVDMRGSFSETLNYRFRWRADRLLTTEAPSGLGAFADIASVSHKAADNVEISFGKWRTEAGGWEGQSPSDLYSFSEAYSGTARSLFNAATGAGSAQLAGSSLIYMTGVRVDYGMGDHSIALQVGNNLYQTGNTAQQTGTITDTTATGNHQTRMGTGILYKGKIAMWQPLLSYHMFDQQALTYAGGKVTFLGFGNRFTFGDIWVDLDYLLNSQSNTAGMDTKVNSINLEGGYKMGNLHPRLKYSKGAVNFTSATGAAAVTTDATNIGLALEYKPKMEDNFRYQLAYNTNSWKASNATVTNSNTEIMAGVSMKGDFLK